ncbi:MAG: hypothetical protein GF317_22765 [Candidatus Lokiarchaeota archaeon]|nr:hypothetical protein [Candidatus Lokiarchaeota archaeon]
MSNKEEKEEEIVIGFKNDKRNGAGAWAGGCLVIFIILVVLFVILYRYSIA